MAHRRCPPPPPPTPLQVLSHCMDTSDTLLPPVCLVLVNLINISSPNPKSLVAFSLSLLMNIFTASGCKVRLLWFYQIFCFMINYKFGLLRCNILCTQFSFEYKLRYNFITWPSRSMVQWQTIWAIDCNSIIGLFTFPCSHKPSSILITDSVS